VVAGSGRVHGVVRRVRRVHRDRHAGRVGVGGATLLGDVQGLEFVLTALFVVLAMEAYRESRDTTTLVLAVGAAVVAEVLAPGSMILVAMAVFAAALAVAVAVTIALPAAPFALKGAIEHSALPTDVGRWMPLGAITILAVYCLAGIELSAPARGAPEVAGVLATVAVHGWRRNVVLSVVAGTAVCLALTRWLAG